MMDDTDECDDRRLDEVVNQLECFPYGVGHAEEGICLLLRMGPYRVMLDCGLQDVSTFGFDRPPADFVLCSHAHTDHARGLLALHKTFPQLPIYASEVTTQLLPLNWTDEAVPMFAQALPWRSPIEFQDGLTVEWFPSGHLPGAAAVLITYTPPDEARPYRVFYTGDFYLSNSRLVEGLKLDELRSLEPDLLIIEGSYGTARYPHRRQQENYLAERIGRAIAEGQSVLLPLPTLGLGQELLMLLRSHHLFTGRDVDIWVDGTIAAGCDAYLELLPHFPASVQNFARHQALFWDDRIRPRVRRLPLDDRDVVRDAPCIVLTDRASDWQSFFEIKQPWLTLLCEPIAEPIAIPDEPQLTVETYLLAQHCDGPGTTQLIHNLRPQHILLVHGNANYLADLTALEELHNRYQLHSPEAGTLVEFPIGETFIQPAPPDTKYEGEVTEYDSVVTLTLPAAIVDDPRWRSLADTGIIEVRWQGQELVVRGLTQRELLTQRSEPIAPSSDGSLRSCCANCVHCRGQRCWNPISPLFNFRVPADGYCPAFESVDDVMKDE